jgi:hypothetical protein
MWRYIEDKELANQILHDVQVDDITDGLWKDPEGRRRIQVFEYNKGMSLLIHLFVAGEIPSTTGGANRANGTRRQHAS